MVLVIKILVTILCLAPLTIIAVKIGRSLTKHIGPMLDAFVDGYKDAFCWFFARSLDVPMHYGYEGCFLLGGAFGLCTGVFLLIGGIVGVCYLWI